MTYADGVEEKKIYKDDKFIFHGFFDSKIPGMPVALIEHLDGVNKGHTQAIYHYKLRFVD